MENNRAKLINGSFIISHKKNGDSIVYIAIEESKGVADAWVVCPLTELKPGILLSLGQATPSETESFITLPIDAMENVYNLYNVDDLNVLKEIAYANAIGHGFHPNEQATPLDNMTMIALLHSELSEMTQALIEEKTTSPSIDIGSIIKNRSVVGLSLYNILFEKRIKDTVEDELADVVLRAFDFASVNNIDILSHIKAKMIYNLSRPYLHNKKI